MDEQLVYVFVYNTIKDPHRYNVQGSDTTMLNIEPFAGTIILSFYQPGF